MSHPARLLQSLQLEEMPVTRSQAHPAQQRGGRSTRSGGRGRGRARAPLPPTLPTHAGIPNPAPVHSYTGRRYYTQALSPTSAQRATEGLESNFFVDTVQSLDSGREKYYAFQLKIPVAVRIYEPTGGRARIECSCEIHRASDRSECIHIFVSHPKLSIHANSVPILTSASGSLLGYMQYSQTNERGTHKVQFRLRCRLLLN